jgi:hypothetical protein
MTNLKMIRAKCRDCSDTLSDIKNCVIPECALYPLRMGHEVKKYPAKKAIKMYCRWCSNNQPKEVRLCPSTDCPIYPVSH